MYPSTRLRVRTFLCTKGPASAKNGEAWDTRHEPDQGALEYSACSNSFRAGTDANQPLGALVLDKSGALYGVTQFGGSSNRGAVFKLTPGKSGYRESVLYSFPGGAGGYLPQAGLTFDNQGSLYGTTYYGGTGNCDGFGCGTVFRLAPGKSGYKESVVYKFKAPPTVSGDFPPLP